MNPTRRRMDGLELFWNYITETEKFLVAHHHMGFDPDAGDNWQKPFEAAFSRIKPCLQAVAKSRPLYLPIEALGRCPVTIADSAHEALFLYLNPREALFGLTEVLASDEYRDLKKMAGKELEEIRAKMPKRKMRFGVRNDALILAAALVRLHQIDSDSPVNGPFSQEEIGNSLGWCQSKVSRRMRKLFPSGMSGYRMACRSGILRKGFFRRLENGQLDVDGIHADQDR
jgi:hypothetical protein